MKPSPTPLWIYRTLLGGEVRDLLCILPPDVGFERGLPPEAIVGTLLNPTPNLESPEDGLIDLSQDNFAVNTVFRTFFHEIIRRHAPDEPGIDGEARRIGNGYVYVIDRRTPDPGGNVPPEDIIGGFEVRQGAVVREAYFPNPNYRLLGQNGFFTLSGTLYQRLLEAIAAKRSDA